ncbi:MAG: histidinol-phosphate aminotransferase family protein [Deltaproteobacteria bacterium]|nr:histidinol-phosphate aminotransferase family protein [Deltaproteobacteria bacterium]
MYIKEHIKAMTPYLPPLEGRASEGKYTLLDFNERTAPPGPAVLNALRTFIDSGAVQAYPEYGDLEAKIAKYAEVPAGQVMVTNGSDQGIEIIYRAGVSFGDGVIIPSPSFAMFYQVAGVEGARLIRPSYHEDLSFPASDVLAALCPGVKLVVIVSPNNPTGSVASEEQVRAILDKAAGLGAAVLLDEAYFEFHRQSFKHLILSYANLFIIRTFSKAFGLPSLRVGYVISREENIKELLKIRGPYDVNMLARVGVMAALDHLDYVQDYVQEVMGRSKPLLESFFDQHGVSYYPSWANFITFRPPDQMAAFEALKLQGILVRPRSGPCIDGTLRVSLGTVRETRLFIDAYKHYLTNGT